MKESDMLKDVYYTLLELRHDLIDLKRLVRAIPSQGEKGKNTCEIGAGDNDCSVVMSDTIKD